MNRINRWISPDGQRIVLTDHRTGDVWFTRRVSPAEADDLMAVVTQWEKNRGQAKKPRRHREVPLSLI